MLFILIGGSKGGARDAPQSNYFHFHAVSGKNPVKITGWRPLPVWEILDATDSY